MIGNLGDYEASTHAVPYDDLPDLDKHLLGVLSEVMKEVDTWMMVGGLLPHRSEIPGCWMGFNDVC